MIKLFQKNQCLDKLKGAISLSNVLGPLYNRDGIFPGTRDEGLRLPLQTEGPGYVFPQPLQYPGIGFFAEAGFLGSIAPAFSLL